MINEMSWYFPIWYFDVQWHIFFCSFAFLIYYRVRWNNLQIWSKIRWIPVLERRFKMVDGQKREYSGIKKILNMLFRVCADAGRKMDMKSKTKNIVWCFRSKKVIWKIFPSYLEILRKHLKVELRALSNLPWYSSLSWRYHEVDY